MPTYPLGVTRSFGTWNAQQNHVERALDNATYDAAHPDDALLLVGPARRGVARTSAARTMAPLGHFQSFGVQTSVPLQPMMAIGSGRPFFLRGKTQTSWNIGRTWLNGKNLLRALYHNAVEANVQVDQFDDPAALEGSPTSQFFINLDSELYYIPFGLAIIMRTKAHNLVASCYLELCMINSWGTQIGAGQAMVAEMVSGLCDRVVAYQASDAMATARVGRALMDAVLGIAANAQPASSTTRIAAFDESGMNDGTTPGL